MGRYLDTARGERVMAGDEGRVQEARLSGSHWLRKEA